ncbi:putative tubulin polyglutamylase TTLL2 [Phytophthora cactorum]|nr:putative tubulin polyglutamylase TTLL2 [Phytophthora cactorum]
MEGKKTSKRAKRVRINVTLCRYEVVRRVARARGWKLVTDDKPEGKPSVCNIHWIDVPDILPTFKTLLQYQKVNHFPGMANLACKSKLARNLERMKKLFPGEYDFVPRTWILPFDQYDFQQNFNSEGESQRTFIVKPDHMCQGRGDGTDGTGSKRSLKWFFAWLKEKLPDEKVDKLWDQIGDICLKTILSVQPTLAQEYRSTFAKYMRRPNSASTRSGPQASDMSMGLDIKKARPGSGGERVYDDTSESFSPARSSTPPSCSFALLGMDVLIDEQLKPWLLEVNHLPSFGCDSPLDWSVKEPLISQTFDLLNISTTTKSDTIPSMLVHSSGGFTDDFAPRGPVTNNGQQLGEDTSQVTDGEQLIDFVRIYPPLSSQQDSKYRRMLDASQQHIDELQLRFSAPLQHRRLETDSNGVVLPLLKGAQKKEQLVETASGFLERTKRSGWRLQLIKNLW